jgi:hypothetical protein
MTALKGEIKNCLFIDVLGYGNIVLSENRSNVNRCTNDKLLFPIFQIFKNE